MRLGRVVVAIFCLVSTISRPALAVGTDGQNTVKRSRVAAIVRLENDQVKCVKFANHIKVDESRLQIPLCETEGEQGELNQIAMSVAQSRGPRTAFLSHLAFAAGGCFWGAGVAMGVGSLQSQYSETGETDGSGPALATGGSAVGAYLAALSFAEPTGHALSLSAGVLVCGGAISYLIYDERASKK